MAISIASPKPRAIQGSRSPGSDKRAAELVSHLPLADGLRACLSLADNGSPSFGRTAIRWHSCFCGQAPGLSLSEALGVLAALGNLRGVGWRAAGEELRDLSLQHQQDEAVEVLDRWLRRPGRLSP